jgi:hypothetical protein
MAAAEWSERTRLLVTLGVMVLVNLGAWGFTYKASQDHEATRLKMVGLQKEVKVLMDEEEKEKELTSQIEKFDREHKKLAARLPDVPKRERLASKMSELAQQYKMNQRPSRYEQGRKPDVPGLNPQNFLCDVCHTQYEADFNSLCYFMNTLEEHYDYFLALEDLSITANSSGMGVTDVSKHEVTLTIISYQYRAQTGP